MSSKSRPRGSSTTAGRNRTRVSAVEIVQEPPERQQARTHPSRLSKKDHLGYQGDSHDEEKQRHIGYGADGFQQTHGQQAPPGRSNAQIDRMTRALIYEGHQQELHQPQVPGQYAWQVAGSPSMFAPTSPPPNPNPQQHQ